MKHSYDVKKINSITRSLGNTQVNIQYCAKGAVFFALRDKNADPLIRTYEALKNAKLGTKAKQLLHWMAESFGIAITMNDGKVVIAWTGDYTQREEVAAQAAADSFELVTIPKKIAAPVADVAADTAALKESGAVDGPSGVNAERAIHAGPTVFEQLAALLSVASDEEKEAMLELVAASLPSVTLTVIED